MTDKEKIVYDEILDMLLYYKMLGSITPTSGIEVEHTAKRIVMLLQMEREKYININECDWCEETRKEGKPFCMRCGKEFLENYA